MADNDTYDSIDVGINDTEKQASTTSSITPSISKENSHDKSRERSRSLSISSGHGILTALRLPGHRNSDTSADLNRQHSNSSASSAGSFIKKILGERDKSSDSIDTVLETESKTRRRSSITKESLTPAGSNDSFVDESEIGLVRNKKHPIKIPSVFLEDGMSLLKVSQTSKKRVLFQIDPNTLSFVWKVANRSSIQPTSSTSGIHKLLLSAQSHSIYPNRDKSYEFSIDDIKKTLYQEEARYYRDELNISRELEGLWISVSYFDHDKGKVKTLHLIADTEQDFKKFHNTLDGLRKLRVELSEKLYIDLENMDDKQKELIMVSTSSSITSSSAKNNKEHLTFDDIVKYISRLNLNIGRNHLRQIFDSLNCHTMIGDQAVLDFNEFKDFIALLKKRPDIESLWSTLTNQREAEKETVEAFINNIQHEGEHKEVNFEKVFSKFATSNGKWTPESLNQFLLSKYSKPVTFSSHEDDYYSHPLNEYLISSSHNTYLTGKQIADMSSAEGYVRTLQKGCRCVEIDIWDGNDPETGEIFPIVCHGKAFTTSISLRNVLLTIKKYAFVSSSYPLILSLETNCSPACQVKVVELLNEILKDSLLTNVLRQSDILPSPAELKHKILIKAKKTTSYDDLIITESGAYVSSTTSTSVSEDNFNTHSDVTKSRKKRRRQVIDQLSDLALYVQGLRFRNFSLPESKTFNHCFSLNEKVIDSMLRDVDKVKSVDKHNRKFMMRIYPSNFRLKSSNYTPIKYWRHGAQMVSTNWQTYDLGQQINEALFDGPNSSGYFLKPTDIRKPLLKHTLRTGPRADKKEIRFEFTIVSAHQLPKPKQKDVTSINPFVKVDVIGGEDIEIDNDSFRTRTSIINDNGFNPSWLEKFSGKMTASELVFVKFSLNTMTSKDDDTVLGVFVSRLDNLKRGYRYLPLRDALGEELIYSSLFVKIDYWEGKAHR